MALNSVIAGDLLPLLCPTVPSSPLDIGELLAATCPMPTHRFVQTASGEAAVGGATSLEQLRPALDALVRAAGRSVSAPRSMRPGAQGGNVLAAHVVIRGAEVPDGLALRRDILDRLGGTAAWQSGAVDLRWSAVPLRAAVTGGSLQAVRVSALVNWRRVSQVIQGVVAQARKKHAGRAFVHWYERHGFEVGDFEHSFEVLEAVIADYEAA